MPLYFSDKTKAHEWAFGVPASVTGWRFAAERLGVAHAGL